MCLKRETSLNNGTKSCHSVVRNVTIIDRPDHIVRNIYQE